MAEEAPLARDNTMTITAKEGVEFLEKVDPKLAQECKDAQKNGTDVPKSNGAGDAPEANGKTDIKRDNTMVTTAEEGKIFLEKEGGVNEDAKTRSQEKELNDSKSEDKEATKRPADDKEEPVDEKKAKIDEEKSEKPAAKQKSEEETPAK